MDVKERRRWRRENSAEIERLIAWINAPDVFVAVRFENDKRIIMGHESIAALGEIAQRTKLQWKEYLTRRGVPQTRFLIAKPAGS